MSLLIKNGKAFINGELIEKNIFINNGKIKKILPKNKTTRTDNIIDAKNKIILPGLIDCHVHFREPGLTHKGDFFTESRAAAKGGVTTILDMPNTIPPTITAKLLEQKRNLASKSVVNYGFHFGASVGKINEVKKAKNIASVKLYMDYTTGDLKIDEHDYIVDLLKASRITALHAEEGNIKNIIDILINNKIKNKLHFCHVSSENELTLATQNKVKSSISVEVTPHHLFMNKKDVERLGPYAEMKPRLKSEKDRKALWEGIKNGIVDVIATDHAPHLMEEKENPEYPFGVPGLETMLPLLLDAFNNKQIGLKKIVELCAENPSRIFRIKNKGYIREGFDADLTVVDLSAVKEVKKKELLTKCGWSPFEGRKLKGWPSTTIVRGNIIYDNGAINNIKAMEVEYGR